MYKYNLNISRCILHANVLLLLMAMTVSCVNNHCSNREITNRCIKHTLLELSKHGHNLPLEHINKYDASGNKHGIWIDENESFIYMTSYKNGQKDGIETIYYKLGKRTVISYIIYYTDGFSKHIITYSENGNVLYTIENFELNDSYPEFKESFPYIGYTKNYYPSGKIQSEGYTLYGSDWEIDFEDIGNWKFYDENGNCIEKEYYKTLDRR